MEILNLLTNIARLKDSDKSKNNVCTSLIQNISNGEEKLAQEAQMASINAQASIEIGKAKATHDEKYENGQIKSEKLPNGAVRYYNEYGNVTCEILPSGIKKSDISESGEARKLTFLNGTLRVYNDEGVIKTEILPEPHIGMRSRFGDKIEMLPNGKFKSWHKNGQIAHEDFPDGTSKYWDKDGNIEQVALPNGIIIDKGIYEAYFYAEYPWGDIDSFEERDFQKISDFLSVASTEEMYAFVLSEEYRQENNCEFTPDGTIKKYHRNGQLACEYLPNGTCKEWHENGLLSKQKTSNFEEKTWYKTGQLQSEIAPDGTIKKYHRNGQLAEEERPYWIAAKKWHDNGQLAYEAFYDKRYYGNISVGGVCDKSYYPNGQIKSDKFGDTEIHSWYENGQIKQEYNGYGDEYTLRTWYKNGELQSEHSTDGIFRVWDENGELESEKKYPIGQIHSYQVGYEE